MNPLKRECRVCGGEGTVLVNKPGGEFDLKAECWYPAETLMPCLKCKGSGLDPSTDPATVFNTTPQYARLKAERKAKRRSTNQVVAMLLGLSPQDLNPKSEEAA